MDLNTILVGDVRDRIKDIPDESIQCVVTSPPYFGLRNYCDEEKQIGLEPTVDAYVAELVAVFREVRRVLRKDGVVWLNLGSSYASGDSGPSQFRYEQRVPSCDSDGTALRGSTVLDFAYLGLCDECLDDYRSHRDRIAGNIQHQTQSQQPESKTVRDNGRQDCAEAFPVALPRVAQESTMLESWRQLRGECLRCDSRASALLSLGSSSRDGLASAHMARSTNGKVSTSDSWGFRTWGKELSSTASVESPIVQPQYTMFKPKDMIPVPWMVAMALQRDGWWLRQDVIWSKLNPMPESVRDRCTKSHEYLFMLTKSARYYYDHVAIKEPMKDVSLKRLSQPNVMDQPGGPKDPQTGNRSHRKAIRNQAERLIKHEKWKDRFDGWDEYDRSLGRNKRSVWTIATQPLKEAHFATFPEALVEPCILAGTSEKGECPECGKAWMRVVVREAQESPASYNGSSFTGGKTEAPRPGMGQGMRGVTTSTGEWSPQCTCGHDPIPQAVLDPFIGSGTVAVVAERHGRNWLGIDLTYQGIAWRRIEKARNTPKKKPRKQKDKPITPHDVQLSFMGDD